MPLMIRSSAHEASSVKGMRSNLNVGRRVREVLHLIASHRAAPRGRGRGLDLLRHAVGLGHL